MNTQLAYQAAALSRSIGLGALTDDVAAALKLSTDPLKIAKQFWGQIQGRTWDQAMTAASARAASKIWPAKNLDAKNDFISILVSSAINAKQAADNGNLEMANDLNRTWVILANRMGLDKTTPADAAKLKSQATTEIAPIIIIVGIVMAALAVSAIYIALIYFASQVIDDVLSKIECDRELIRLHNEYNKIVEKGGPQSDADKQIRDQLLEQQRIVAAGCTVPKPGFDVWPWILGVGLVSATTLGVVYRKEIGSWLTKR